MSTLDRECSEGFVWHRHPQKPEFSKAESSHVLRE